MKSSINNIECDGNMFLLESIEGAPEELRAGISICVGLDREKSTGDFKKYTGIVGVFEEPFKELSADTQQFIIYHEIGHMLQEGGLPPTQTEYITESLKYEHIADNFAVSKIGKDRTLNALDEISEFFRKFINVLPWEIYNRVQEEFKERIRTIKNSAGV